ncbi:MAG: YkgJ family cysteine cluster protein [Gammaproteobacteria bacterium]|nr:MAG: YkgJ family cysteine cluster protein [Gammaproteobacteria bacterium]
MSDEKLDIPEELASANLPVLLTGESKLKFRCYKGISCFNACCKAADVTLAPYDVLRLQRRLGMDSAEFLKKHTVPFQLERDGVPGIKLRTDDEGACLLLDGENGCSVYEDRPTVCRYYPVGLLAMRRKDSPVAEEKYSLVVEEHCKGHEEDREITVAEYRKEQGVEEYDEFNREWYELILKKRSGGPGVGKPNEMSLQLFFMASFNFDMFRRFVLSDNFKNTYDLPQQVYDEIEQSDEALIKFGYRLMRQVLFGEMTIPEQKDAWDRRVKERKAVWEARMQAEIAARNAKAEEAMREETLGTDCNSESCGDRD